MLVQMHVPERKMEQSLKKIRLVGNLAQKNILRAKSHKLFSSAGSCDFILSKNLTALIVDNLCARCRLLFGFVCSNTLNTFVTRVFIVCEIGCVHRWCFPQVYMYADNRGLLSVRVYKPVVCTNVVGLERVKNR